MKKLTFKTAWLCFALWLLSYCNTRAQYIVNGKEIDTSFNHQMNLVFGNLDKSKVPFGLLKDYALEFTNLSCGGTAMADSTLMTKISITLVTNVITYKAMATASG